MISRMSAMIQPADDSDASAASIALMGGSIEAAGITRGTALYRYDEFNRLTSYSDPKENSAEYTYYADGLRKSKTVGADTIEYYYNGQNVINETKNGSNYATNILGVNGYICRTQDGITGYFLRDGHGDIQTAYAEDRTTKLADYTYDAWGNQNNTEALSWGENNPIRYAGQYYDTESGMFYLRARYYDSSMGRFISADPHWNPDNMIYGDSNDAVKYIISAGYKYYYDKNNNVIDTKKANYYDISSIFIIKLPDIIAIQQSGNLYTYTINNPANQVDTSGRFAVTATVTTVGAVEALEAAGIILSATAAITSAIYTISEIISKSSQPVFYATWIRGGTVQIGKSLNLFDAMKRIKEGKSVYATNSTAAYALAKIASNGKEPVYDAPHGGAGYK